MADQDLERRRAAVLAMVPEAVRRAVESRDLDGLKAALASLGPREAGLVVHQLVGVGILNGPEPADEADSLLEEFEPLLGDIIAIARGEEARRPLVEQVLAGLEEAGWHLREAAQLIWEGERDATLLAETAGDEEAALIRRILERLA